MKAKTIKSVLRKKLNEWTASIEDDEVRELVKKNTIVTGGSIASMLLKEKVNDFDVYFRNRKTALAVARYYVGRFAPHKASGIPMDIVITDGNKLPIPDDGFGTDERIMIKVRSAGIASEDGADAPYEYFESSPDERTQGYVAEVMQDPGMIEDVYEETEAAALEADDKDYRPVFLSTNAITLSGKIQIIIRFFGEPDEIHENYDFVHCTNYWTSWDGELVLRPAALEALLARELRYVGSKYPICSIIRLRKFIKRNWTINAGQILKMCMQISELDLDDVDVLEDQLTGVDVAYFSEVVDRLRDKDPEKVNHAYLIEIIDRMF